MDTVSEKQEANPIIRSTTSWEKISKSRDSLCSMASVSVLSQGYELKFISGIRSYNFRDLSVCFPLKHLKLKSTIPELIL